MNKDIVKTESQDPERVSERPTILPAVDLFENDDELLLVADMPGVSKDALSVEIHDTTLSLEGRRKTEQKGRSVLGVEFESVTWAQSWRGNVAYTANSGKNVTLSNMGWFAPGTVLSVQ